MPLDFTPIEQEVTELTDVVGSVIALVESLADQVEATAGDPAKVTELATTLRARKQALADAVAAHTPGGPPPAGGQRR